MPGEREIITHITEERNETTDFFGEDFKSHTFFDTPENAFGNEHWAIERSGAKTETIIEGGKKINAVSYEYEGRQKLIFSWDSGIGDNNTYYMIRDLSGTTTLEDGTTALDVEDFGLVTENGKVARIGKGIKSKVDRLKFVFILDDPNEVRQTATPGRTFTKLKGKIDKVETDHIINTSPPLHRGGWNKLMHELGHVLTEDYLSSKLSPEELDRYTDLMLATIRKIQDYRDNRVATNENIMQFNERAWLAWSERKANALALQLGRVIEENLGLKRNSLTDKETLQGTISSYGVLPYNITTTPNNAKVPSFDSNSRVNARTLQRLITQRNYGSYKQLKNFDDTTGKHIGNDPKRQIKSILEQ